MFLTKIILKQSHKNGEIKSFTIKIFFMKIIILQKLNMLVLIK